MVAAPTRVSGGGAEAADFRCAFRQDVMTDPPWAVIERRKGQLKILNPSNRKDGAVILCDEDCGERHLDG